jgi:hypothetical protein
MKIGKDIWTLATMLDITDVEVDGVKYEFRTDLLGACFAIMQKYQKRWGNEQDRAKANLIKVLRNDPLRRQDIVDEITRLSDQ